MVKVLLIFIVFVGALGLYVKTFDLPCNLLVLGIITFVISIIIALLYANKIIFNVGYLSILILFCLISSLSSSIIPELFSEANKLTEFMPIRPFFYFLSSFFSFFSSFYFFIVFYITFVFFILLSFFCCSFSSPYIF